MKNNRQELEMFSKVMWGVAGNFGGKISQDDLALRFEVLAEYSIDQIKKAGVWLLKHREATFPAVPTTKEFIDAITLVGGKSPRLIAENEADKVIQTLSEWGRDAEALFNDKITVYLMTKRWGFQKLDVLNIKDPGLVWWRKEFTQAYQDIEKSEAAGVVVLGVAGGNESRLTGMANASTKRIE